VARRRHVPLSATAPQIRRATPADAETLAMIQVHGHRWAYATLLPQPASDVEWIARRTEVWGRLLAPDDPGRAFLAERDARAVGFVTIGPSDDPTLPATTGMLFALYLEPDAIGSGVGRALLAYAVDALAAAGFADAVLWVLEQNARARRFYEIAGWRADGTCKDYERDGAARHELRYRRALLCQ
jgi:GNAT superfamily N-acetyltransferase